MKTFYIIIPVLSFFILSSGGCKKEDPLPNNGGGSSINNNLLGKWIVDSTITTSTVGSITMVTVEKEYPYFWTFLRDYWLIKSKTNMSGDTINDSTKYTMLTSDRLLLALDEDNQMDTARFTLNQKSSYLNGITFQDTSSKVVTEVFLSK